MSYQVLARKWRPRNFSELVGQEHVRRALVNALDHDRLHHAYLFTGTRGVGKTTIARIFAKSLNCEKGVGSTPCGKCSACEEIDSGRFVDLVEVDAASRTKVEDTRELLENVQYAPTRGRYKVYLIDEVHMLSGHSFNALLKTLEEPPPHVKFLLATTDPQKLPVTILSRCLQFNLKRLSVPQISGQLESILRQEKIEADETAIRLVAFAADGSLRDALSLLDQAIAYGSGALAGDEVRAMLGTIDRDTVYRILDRLADNDAAGLLDELGAADEFAPDYDSLLADILSILQRVALVQVLPDAVDDTFGDRDAVLGLGERLAPEDVQLYYQIGLIGRRDLSLSPEPRGGFEMVMLRMLAFRPGDTLRSEQGATHRTAEIPVQANRSKPGEQAAPAVPVNAAPENGAASAEWALIVDKLDLKGLTHQLAVNCALQEVTDTAVILAVDPSHTRLLSKVRSEQIEKALCRHYGRDLRLKVLEGGHLENETPAGRRAREQENRQRRAIESIENDENIKAMQDTFGATVNYDSIRPRD